MKFKKYLSFLCLFLLIISSKRGFAYPNFIGHGYNSCITCHYNPFGNGPLNDYGRAVSATAIGDRRLYSTHKPEEQLGDEAGFFFENPKSKNFRPFIGYRGLLLKKNVGTDIATTDWINMQLDGTALFKFGPKDQFTASYTFGYAPIPRSLKNTPAAKNFEEYRSHEHYFGYRPNDHWGFYIGLLDKPYGIRLIEHNSFSRTTPLLTMNDQSHGVIVHYVNDRFEGGFNYFMGNFSQDIPLRQKGLSTTFEYTLAENFRPGASFLKSKNQYLDLTSFSTHLRTALGKTGSIMAEVGQTSKKSLVSSSTKKELYGFVQSHLKANRGFYILNSIEYYKNSAEKNYKIRFGPSLQYFPMSRIEFRVDLYNTRLFSTELSTPDVWDLLAQVHLWF